jgi:hypothetical protein
MATPLSTVPARPTYKIVKSGDPVSNSAKVPTIPVSAQLDAKKAKAYSGSAFLEILAVSR